jgi:putative PIN family toxin of toxin-antitoxin system
VRVFLDTNVLASALATRGLCADILREVINSDELIVSDPLLVELHRILPRKFNVPKSLVEEMITFLQQDTIHSQIGDLLDIRIKDKDDIIILSSAISGKADLFVTGDKEVLSLGKVGRMEILSPRGFWDKTRKRKRA